MPPRLIPPVLLMLWIVVGLFGGAWLHGIGYSRKLDERSFSRPLMWGGVFLYVKESGRADTLERFGQAAPISARPT